ncbi:MAG: 4Fe-4S dicluster domain-containing protein [Chloroflexi bacterium]|nr:4Fe-4S dicluster domain-containing protein [Chloroflexota bacterium]
MGAKGMFVDTSICTGCKACQVACKEWNGLDGAKPHFTGDSYDNTATLSALNWRHVRFIEQFSDDRSQGRWLFMSDSCKHCSQAGCMEACPVNAIIRREDTGNVFIKQETCIGCRYCVAACPFGVISYSEITKTVHKCTLCDDRIHAGLETACAKACPTDSITFGDVDELRVAANKRLATLKGLGQNQANLYGADPNGDLNGLNVFYLLMDKPSVYGQPDKPELPQKRLPTSTGFTVLAAAVTGLAALVNFRSRGAPRQAQGAAKEMAK